MEMDHRYIEIAKATQHYCQPLSKKLDEDTFNSNPIDIQARYFNGLPYPVTIVLRSGVKFTIPPSQHRHIKNFVISFKVTLGPDVNIDVNSLCNDSSPESAMLVDIFSNGGFQRMGRWQCAEIQYGVTKEELDQMGSVLYLSNLDIVVARLNPSYVPYHPYSEAGIRKRLVAEDPDINTHGRFGYRIEIVDNCQRFGQRFININNEVFKLLPERDPDRRDGVYRYSTGPVNGDTSLTSPVSQFFSFEEAEQELGLFRTFVEAKTLGDVVANRKKELDEYALSIKEEEARLKHEKLEREEAFEKHRRSLEEARLRDDDERRQKEHNWKLREQEYQERAALLKEEIARLEHQRNLASMERKDYYDERSHNRKDSSEFIKYLPTLVTTIAAIVATIYSINNGGKKVW